MLPASAGTGPGDATADLSRKHLLQWDGPVLTVVGGKLTTYRAMAEETVDAVVARLGAAPARRRPRGCRWSAPRRAAALERVPAPRGWSPGTARRRRSCEALGTAAGEAGRPETVGELRFAVRHEGARTVADLLDRRTRIGLVPADRARAVGGGRAGAGRGALEPNSGLPGFRCTAAGSSPAAASAEDGGVPGAARRRRTPPAPGAAATSRQRCRPKVAVGPGAGSSASGDPGATCRVKAGTDGATATAPLLEPEGAPGPPSRRRSRGDRDDGAVRAHGRRRGTPASSAEKPMP